MVEELLVSDQLTPEMITAGSALVTSLDKLNVIVKGAFWLLLEDQRRWRLVIASPEVRLNGPKAVYRKIRAALNRRPPGVASIGTNDVSAIDDKDPLFSLLRIAISTGPGISGIRFSRNVINGQMIADAYLYRVVS